MDTHSRFTARQRDLAGAAGIVIFLFGWSTLWRWPGDSWQDTYALPTVLTVMILGFRWAPERGQQSMTLRARRARAWVAVALLLATFPALAWMHYNIDGFYIGSLMLVVGVLVERWGLTDFKFTDLWAGKPKEEDPQVRLLVGKRRNRGPGRRLSRWTRTPGRFSASP